MLASLHELTKQNTLQTGHYFCEIAKKVSISILFQKVCLGWKLSQIINRLWGWKKNVQANVRHSRVGTKFHLKMTLLNFWIKLTRKGYFWAKANKNYYRILHIHIQINIDSKFRLQQFWFFGQISKKSILPVKNRKQKKFKHHYWIVHIWISLSTNFQLKMTILIFGTKLPKKGSHFQSKAGKIDTSTEFCIFELLNVSNFTLNKQFGFFGLDLP